MLATAPLDLATALAHCREAMGAHASSTWKAHSAKLAYERPFWLNAKEPLLRAFDDQELLFTRGRVVLGTLVQANSQLFQHGDIGAPAEIVYSEDPHFEQHPADLFQIANQLFELKATQPADPELRRFADHVTNERTRMLGERLPDALTEGRDVRVSSVFVDRRHLPNGWLADNLFPVLVAPESTPACALLPARFWPNEWLALWDEPAPIACDHSKGLRVPGRGVLVPVLLVVDDLWVSRALDAVTGVEHFMRDHPVAESAPFAVSGAILLALAPWLRKSARKRYLIDTCAHRVEVERDDRFLLLSPRVWGIAMLALAAGIALWQVTRG